MTMTIEVRLVEGWIAELQSILKRKSEEAKTRENLAINQSMRQALDQVQSRINTWRRHHENIQALNGSGEKFLITNEVNTSEGRYRKLEWYEGHLFLSLAWRHGQGEERGELMLELRHVEDLSTSFLVYQGTLSFDELAALAREGGLGAIKSGKNRQEWVEKVWT